MQTTRSLALLAGAALLAAGGTGCDDPTAGLFDPLLVEDTVEIGVPLAERPDLPSALDVTVEVARIAGGRFPERTSDAERWDVTLRRSEGTLMLTPPAAIGLESRAAVSDPIEGTLFEEVREPPPTADLRTETAVPLRSGRVYVVRSRATSACREYFAKLEPVEMDVEDGRARLRVVTNGRCGDRRLVMP